MTPERLLGILPSLLFIICVAHMTRMWIDGKPVYAAINAAVAILALVQVIKEDQ